jgi:transposase
MARPANPIKLNEEERQTLHRWLESPKAEERLVLRGSIVLLADRGVATVEIARRLRVRPSTVSRWRSRFARQRLVGLQDRPRSGKPREYNSADERRVLELAASRPPKNAGAWTGALIAGQLGDVSADYVWKVLRRHNVTLNRRRLFRIPVSAPLDAKIMAFGGLFLSPPENAFAVMLLKGAMDANMSRAGVMRLPGSRAFNSTGSGSEISIDLTEALGIATQLIREKEYPEQPHRHFLDFMERLVSYHPEREIHVFLNTIRTHKPGRDQWLARHPLVRFHYLQAFRIWLAQFVLWAEMLSDRSASPEGRNYGLSLYNEVIAFSEVFDKHSSPFEWTLTAGGSSE